MQEMKGLFINFIILYSLTVAWVCHTVTCSWGMIRVTGLALGSKLIVSLITVKAHSLTCTPTLYSESSQFAFSVWLTWQHCFT